MKRTLLAAAASLALAIPAGYAIAQDTTVATDAAGNVYVMTAPQKTVYDGWPADRRTAYDAWPNEAKTYYWTLTPAQVEGWWVLNDEQRVQIVGMTPEQRTAAWTSISAQMSGQAAAPAAADTTSADAEMATTTTTEAPMASTTTTAATDTSMMASTSGGAMQFVRKETAQTVAASADTAALASGDLPTCKKGQQDGCINSWEKNKTGTKPLSYWPGKPASEIPGKKPDPAPSN